MPLAQELNHLERETRTYPVPCHENEFSFTHKVESKAQEILIQKRICDFPGTERAAGSYFLLNLFISVPSCLSISCKKIMSEHE
jgi:hypothetical protein